MVKFCRYINDTNDDFITRCSIGEVETDNYKKHNKTTKRQVPKTWYVIVQWFLDNIHNSCNYCGCGFHIDTKVFVMNNSTCHRVSSLESHSLDNKCLVVVDVIVVVNNVCLKACFKKYDIDSMVVRISTGCML